MESERKRIRKVLITGGTSGLGQEIATKLAAEGMEVWVAGRTLKNNESFNRTVNFLKVDFSDLHEVADVFIGLINTGLKFDSVIYNAGVLGPPSYTETINGFEYTFQVNFLAHLLINEIITMNAGDNDQVVIASVSSPVYRMVRPSFRIPERSHYRSFKAYSESKYYLLLIIRAVYAESHGKMVSGFAFDPGVFNSGIYRTQARWFRSLYRAASPILRNPAGVADNFISVLFSGNFRNGAIFKSAGNYTMFRGNDSTSEDTFMAACKNIISSYLPPSRL